MKGVTIFDGDSSTGAVVLRLAGHLDSKTFRCLDSLYERIRAPSPLINGAILMKVFAERIIRINPATYRVRILTLQPVGEHEFDLVVEEASGIRVVACPAAFHALMAQKPFLAKDLLDAILKMDQFQGGEIPLDE